MGNLTSMLVEPPGACAWELQEHRHKKKEFGLKHLPLHICHFHKIAQVSLYFGIFPKWGGEGGWHTSDPKFLEQKKSSKVLEGKG